jgi:isopentenyl diphosphate isomerase/L-lactate dehydrogenase-like FMN-dependent dehydrogenase
VELYIDKIKTELEQAMVLTDVPSVKTISKAILYGF